MNDISRRHHVERRRVCWYAQIFCWGCDIGGIRYVLRSNAVEKTVRVTGRSQTSYLSICNPLAVLAVMGPTLLMPPCAVVMGLAKDHATSERIIYRGSCIIRRFGCPAFTLAVWAHKSPNARGPENAQLKVDQKDARALQKAFVYRGRCLSWRWWWLPPPRSRGISSLLPPFHLGGAPPGVSPGSGYIPFAQRRCAEGSRTDRWPCDHAHAGVWAARLQLGRGKRARPWGRGWWWRRGRSQPPSNRVLSAVASLNSAVQDAQQQLQPVQGAPTCDKYANAVPPWNPNDDFRRYTFAICSRCKHAGHRSNVCPSEGGG